MESRSPDGAPSNVEPMARPESAAAPAGPPPKEEAWQVPTSPEPQMAAATSPPAEATATPHRDVAEDLVQPSAPVESNAAMDIEPGAEGTVIDDVAGASELSAPQPITGEKTTTADPMSFVATTIFDLPHAMAFAIQQRNRGKDMAEVERFNQYAVDLWNAGHLLTSPFEPHAFETTVPEAVQSQYLSDFFHTQGFLKPECDSGQLIFDLNRAAAAAVESAAETKAS